MLSNSVSRICAILLVVVSLVSAATPTSFCKCTCFGSYKIIPLDARTDSSSPAAPVSPNLARRSLVTASGPRDDSKPDADASKGSDKEQGDRKEYRQKNCNDCNRSFCLEQNLPECKDASEGDVFATCFQRDSSKDEAVVFIFLFTTVGLLSWAIVKPCLDGVAQRRRERNEYIPVSDQPR